ncbi:MAG: hypothetical protein WBX22_19485 [Silvibacterium sp.]
MKAKPLEKVQKASDRSTGGHWNEMNRKQRREMMRKIQSEDLSMEVVHPHAAGIDIGNESHYVAVPLHAIANRCGASGALPLN